jgi:hypothetical protein
LGEARHGVLELGELHLELAVAALGALGEDVQNELRAIDDLEIGVLCDGARLRRRKLPVKDKDAGVELDRAHNDLFELALSHDELRVHVVAHLDDAIDHVGARAPCQLA